MNRKIFQLPLVLVAFVLSMFLGPFAVAVLTIGLIFGIFAMSEDLCWGYNGIPNFGHAAYFGFGAFATAIVWKFTGLVWVGIPIAIVASAALAGVMGFFTFYSEIRGTYVALITLAVSLALQMYSSQEYKYFGGQTGITSIPLLIQLPRDLMSYELQANYALVFISTIVVYLLCCRLVNSKFGFLSRAIKSNEHRAKALGYDTSKHLAITFMLSGALAGFGGALYAHFNRIVAPETLGFLLSAQVFVWTCFGGPGTLIGPLVGAVFLHVLQNIISTIYSRVWLLLLGIIFVISVFFLDQGIVGLSRRLWRSLLALMRI